MKWICWCEFWCNNTALFLKDGSWLNNILVHVLKFIYKLCMIMFTSSNIHCMKQMLTFTVTWKSDVLSFKGLDAGELSSSDEAYSKPKQGHRGQKGKGRPSIRDGPDAIARLINRSPTSDNYKTPTSEWHGLYHIF